MIKIVGTLPVKTRLPLVAWVLAGLVTLFADTGQRPHGTGSEAGNGSLCLDDRSTQFIWGALIPK